MKTFMLMTTAVMCVSTAAFAQSREQQVYYPYPQPVFSDTTQQQLDQQAEAQEMGARRVYPGREAYGRDFGPLTRHPGDYRDAVDRGQWPAGGNVGARSFSIE